MTLDEAKLKLTFHCGSNPNAADPRWKAGFLPMLREYHGLSEAVHLDLVECIRAVEDHLKTSALLDREIMNSLWSICHFARAWALEPDGMLPRNGLISPEEQRRLAEWIGEISETIAMWLDGNDADLPA